MDRDKEFARLVAIELSAEGARRRITQKQIAIAMGLHPNQMSYYKSGSKGDMTVARLVLAAERLRVKPELIVERAYAALVRDFGEAAAAPSEASKATSGAESFNAEAGDPVRGVARPARGSSQR